MSLLRVSGPLFLAAILTVLSGCSMDAYRHSSAGTYLGLPVAIGDGQAQTYVTLDEQGKAQALGIRMTEGALSGLPQQVPPMAWEYDLQLPPQAQGSGYDHVTVDWNPKGHVPGGVYDTPHFDFHFYTVDKTFRDGITATGDDLAIAHRAPPASEMPQGYVLPPGTEVPRMGAHAIDPASPEFHQMPFTYTFIFGFYDGEMIFLEPMTSLEYLRTRPEVSAQVKQPEVYARSISFPATFAIRYNAGQNYYEIALEELVSR